MRETTMSERDSDNYRESVHVVKNLSKEQIDELIESLMDEAFNTKAFLLACQDELEERKKAQ